MERQIPKNVRQIGNVSDSPKIYVEDYVDTFFSQICEKCSKPGAAPMGAFLVGDLQSGGDEEYVYIYGAIQMHSLKTEGGEYVIDDAAWRAAYEDCKQYFEDGEMLGWFVAHSGVPLEPDPSAVRLHKKSFPKKNTVFIMRDPIENEETYYVHKMNDLMEISGHYTYYEKNPCMQNYMISSRKKNGGFSAETVEDRAAKDFRNLVRKRGERKKARKTGRMIYAAGACVILVLIIMGVSMLNGFDRMKSVGDSVGAVAEEKDAQEAVETSGSVVAVTEEEQDEEEFLSEDKDTDVKEEETETEESVLSQEGAVSGTDTENTEDGQADISTAEDTEEKESVLPSSGNGSNGVYVVEEGDTLAIISRKMYGDVTHVDAICKMNGISDGNLIYVGQKLLLP